MTRTKRKITAATRRNYSAFTEAFTALLAEKPFEEISVAELCKKAEIQRVIFYSYFADKYEFFNFYIAQFYDAMAKKLAAFKPLSEEFFRRIFGFFERFTAQNPTVSAELAAAKNKDGGSAAERALCARIYEELSEKRPDIDFPYELFSDEISRIALGFLNWRMSDGSRYSSEAAEEYWLTLFSPFIDILGR